MRFTVLALDYDGTVARDGVLDPDVRRAIAEVRERGLTVAFVTGRILDDLRRVAGDLSFVDAVIAENGAVVAFPTTGYSRVLGTPVPRRFVDDLHRRGVPIVTGQCVVEADACHAHAVLDSIRALELPYVIIFNRGRLMALPTGVNKANGFREALRTLRLSAHNAIAIGDAENDHDLLEYCELGVAVEWGSAALQARADEVLRGQGPSAVAAYIRQAAAQPRLSPSRVGRRQLLLGRDQDGRTFSLAVRGRNLLVAGDPRSGKSWVAGLLCEQLIQHGYSVCVIDPEGDYTGLDTLPGVVLLGGGRVEPTARELRTALRYPDVNVVVDLSQMPHAEKWSYIPSLLAGITRMRHANGIPHRVILDEAHYLLYEDGAGSFLDLELAGYTLVTYQPSRLHPDLLNAMEAIVVTRLTDNRELDALTPWCGENGERRTILRTLRLSEAAVLPATEEAGGRLTVVELAARITPHVRHREKYIDVPVPAMRGFVFTKDGKPTGVEARTLREFVTAVTSQPTAAFAGHLRRGDFSRWFSHVFGDTVLSDAVHDIEEQFRIGRIADAGDALAKAVRSRYELDTEEES
ncbi:MAG TPA: HAD hydrolase family protein [Vicinamibacterales bacterium]